MWPLHTLAKICAGGTFCMVGVVVFVREEIQGRIRKSECYKEALKYLHANNGAVKYFGEPITPGYVNNIYDFEGESDTVLLYKVPLRGPNGKGSLYYKAIKDTKWVVSRVEVELDKLPNKKFLIMDKNLFTKSTEEKSIEDETTGEKPFEDETTEEKPFEDETTYEEHN